MKGKCLSWMLEVAVEKRGETVELGNKEQAVPNSQVSSESIQAEGQTSTLDSSSQNEGTSWKYGTSA